MKYLARVWKFPDNINTDLILPNVAFYLTPQEQLRYVFRANRPGWVDQVKQGDVMFKILPTLYQARLDSEMAEAQVAQLEFNNTKRSVAGRYDTRFYRYCDN